MPKVLVMINKSTGELQIHTDGIEGDLNFDAGVLLTDELREEIKAKLGGGGVYAKSDVEQHKPDGGVRHAHIQTHMGHRHS